MNPVCHNSTSMDLNDDFPLDICDQMNSSFGYNIASSIVNNNIHGIPFTSEALTARLYGLLQTKW